MKLPPSPSQEVLDRKNTLVEAIETFHIVQFVYVKDGEMMGETYKAIPCRVGMMPNGNLTLEAYNPNWRNKGGSRQPHKMFSLENMSQLAILRDQFSPFTVQGYEHESSRYQEVYAELL